jgi:hypothetical protein
VCRTKRSDTSAFLFLSTFFKKDLAENVFFLAELVVIFDVIVMGLVEDAV